MNNIKIFNKEINLKSHYCSLFGETPDKIEIPYINLYVKLNQCNAKCPFCIYQDGNQFNQQKFIQILTELKQKIIIQKIAITGGEPTLNWDQFKSVINISKEISPKSELTLNTNGTNWDKLFDETYKVFDYIHLSRHHYNDSINNKIFGITTPSSIEIKNSPKSHNHQIHLKCVLMKDYIDNEKKLFKYLDWSNLVEINDVGLNTLMPVNEFSNRNLVKLDDRKLIGKNFTVSKKFERCGEGCECYNYIYLPENEFRNPIRVYHKNTYNPTQITETLVFDGENLTTGFGGEIIY
jgi:molybdenum cofactor biosynthesis enzyme MoaA